MIQPVPSERDAEHEVRLALRRRGIECGHGRHTGALLPITEARRRRLYDLLRHYSFRLFLRDLIAHRQGAPIERLTRYCSLAVARRYAAEMVKLGLARETAPSCLALTDPTVHSFGPTLEWFVSRALRVQYGIATAWNLRPDSTTGGGDYDVAGLSEGALIYVEVKSSAPRNIDQRQIRAFVQRLDVLVPDLAIFLNDTQLRMLDKLVPALRDALRRRPFARGRLQRVQGEIFARGNRLFLINAEPDLIGNLGICLARFFKTRAARD